jgi:glyceraldehyde-3-phosphate dehydrogenase/erythrose-4-phosphate dehydrogenase
MDKIRVGLNGYGVIGNRVADAVQTQPDADLIVAAPYAGIVATAGLHLFTHRRHGASRDHPSGGAGHDDPGAAPDTLA